MADAPEVDFQVTAAQLDTGLRGVPVGTCWTSLVDPDEGVSYVGYPIADLAFHSQTEPVVIDDVGGSG